ncbi:MAG: TetR/AcrR family transcriptional regulator [Spirochaetia bacterium]|nr:TetR/AcrR family transcriptional regulator [Spirochaetia bacterium]
MAFDHYFVYIQADSVNIFCMGAKERKLREDKARKKAIIDISNKLFIEKGFHNVTMKQIGDVSEYGMGVIYSYFQSKEELYSNVYFQSLVILADMLNEKVNYENPDIEGEIINLFHVFIDFYSEHRAHYKALLHHLHFPLTDLTEKRLIELNQLIDNASVQCRTLLQKGVNAGLYPDMDVVETHLMLYTANVGLISSIIQRGEEDRVDYIRKICIKQVTLMLEGIKAK